MGCSYLGSKLLLENVSKSLMCCGDILFGVLSRYLHISFIDMSSTCNVRSISFNELYINDVVHISKNVINLTPEYYVIMDTFVYGV